MKTKMKTFSWLDTMFLTYAVKTSRRKEKKKTEEDSTKTKRLSENYWTLTGSFNTLNYK